MLRKIHLYLGCLFAPVLVFFVVSGCWQTFRLNDAKKDGSYTPPALIKVLSAVHTHQSTVAGKGPSSAPFRIFVLAMTAAFLVTVILGVLMAFQVSKKNPWVVWLCLLIGIVFPILLLLSLS